MIYSVYLAGWLGSYGNKYTSEKVVALIKSAPDDASFVFIPTIRQISDFKSWLKENELNNLIQFATEEPITNGSHPTEGRRLHIYVLSKTEIKESVYATGINIRGQA